MLLKLLFFPLFVSSLRPTSTIPSKLQSPGPTVVYTADVARQQESPNEESYSSPTAYDYDTTGPSGSPPTAPENTGFVEPIDFSSFLSDVSRKSSGSAASLSPFATESKSKDTFAGFFNDATRKNAYLEPHFGALSSSASSQKARKHSGSESDDGFVDPNVQFRSLFDSSETADGFKPNDFLSYKDDSVGAEPSKGSQTRAFPSFTYSGRQDDEDYGPGPQSSPNERYRSSYRQVDSRDRQLDPYDDSNYYNGEKDESPSGPSPPPRSYKINSDDASYGPGQQDDRGESNSPAVQETAHSPQASNGKSKGGDSGKSKCKKVEKIVDAEEDYGGDYNDEPEGNYDPSTYNSRYKRQSGRKGRGNNNRRTEKKPMTCYVCEDEQGRYAERCSYDSKADPKKGEYYHSSSTSFNDNGKGKGRGNRDRFKREPSLVTSGSVTVIRTSSSNESLPKKVEKRQSQGDRYASGYPEDRPNNDPNNGGGRSRDSEQEDIDEYGENSNEGRGNSGENYEFTPNYNHSPRNTNRPGYGPRAGTRGQDSFGAPADFGRDNGQDSQGFDYDFSIPREFEAGVNLGASNSNNRPIFSGGATKEFSPGGGRGFDNVGYEDYVKKYFPDAFGPTQGPATDSSSYRPEASGSTSYAPATAPSQPNYYHRHRETSPERQHTQQSHKVAPRPYYGHEGGGSGPSGGSGYNPYEGEGPEHLQTAIHAFGQKDRGQGCEKVQKGDMTCYVCRDPRGMKKEECMYKSNDPRNTQMAYHEVSEYSSLPPASILPLPKPKLAGQESKKHEVKKLPTDYDFDY